MEKRCLQFFGDLRGEDQCFKNRIGQAGRIVDRPQNRSGLIQKTVFDRTDGRTGESEV